MVIVIIVFLFAMLFAQAYDKIVYDPSTPIQRPAQPAQQQAVITRPVQSESPELISLKRANNVLLAFCFILMLLVIFLGVRLQQKTAPVMDKYEKLIRKVNRILRE